MTNERFESQIVAEYGFCIDVPIFPIGAMGVLFTGCTIYGWISAEGQFSPVLMYMSTAVVLSVIIEVAKDRSRCFGPALYLRGKTASITVLYERKVCCTKPFISSISHLI